MAVQFNKEKFVSSFANALVRLTESERITKDVLTPLSRDVLEAVHATGDIGYVNKLLAVLTPMNRKTAVLYFKHFTGFSHDDVSGLFTGKSKKRYDKAFAESTVFLQDPMNNMFSWAMRHIEMEVKPFDASKVGKTIQKLRAGMHSLGKTDADLLREVFKAGVSTDALIVVLKELQQDGDVVDVEAKEIPALPAPF